VVAALLFSAALLIDAVIGPTTWVTLPLLWCAVASIGLVLANATALALDCVRSTAGTGSALLGALQFGVAGAVAPLVGIAGSHTAIPMAAVMTGCAVVALIALVATNAGP
jgi:DHA1 family bicyclomycin/chloramphenicol resistance-like MFS transporter